jgi:hypothetical protein
VSISDEAKEVLMSLTPGHVEGHGGEPPVRNLVHFFSVPFVDQVAPETRQKRQNIDMSEKRYYAKYYKTFFVRK